MEATSTIGLPLIALGRVNVPKIKPPKKSTATTMSIVIREDHTPFDIALLEEPQYTDAQFSADLRKASKRLDAMVKQALEEDAQGKTRKFPM